MKLSRELLVLLSITFVLTLISVFLGFRIYRNKGNMVITDINDLPPTPTPVLSQVLDQSQYNVESYAVTVPGEDLSKTELVQLRGVIDSWDGDNLLIKVQEKTLSVKVPAKVDIRCMPEMMTDANGKTFRTSEVFLDFKNAPVKGVPTDIKTVQKEFLTGEDLTVQVVLEGEDDMEAVFMVGYGCRL